jgi:hypothetical protein
MRLLLRPLLILAVTSTAVAAPLSKELEIDFFREVPNRNLKGIAVRSDGRLLNGPTVRDLGGSIPADLVWSFVSDGRPNQWLVGTGPEGKVFRVDTSNAHSFTTEMVVDLEATHVFSLLRLSDAAALAGTSPQGTLTLVQEGRIVAAVTLPVDSVLDLALVPGRDPVALVATGNPGRIYRVDLNRFAAAGETKEKLTDAAELEKRGITTFGEVRDRNVRRLLTLADGRVVAGSAPRGNVYVFPATGGFPRILLENRDAEVTDLLAGPDGSFYAALTVSSPATEARVARGTTTPPTPPAPTEATDGDTTRAERFSGRGQLVYFPASGLPETIVTRNNTAFYRLAWHESGTARWILISGGEQGELIAYSVAERRSVNLGAIASAQANVIQPSDNDTFLVLRNNITGLSRLDFGATQQRSLETRRLDLGVPAELGQLRFGQLRGVEPDQLQVSVRTSFGSDELEGWSAWTLLRHEDGGWFAPGQQGRYVQIRLTLASTAASTPLIDRATLYYLPQNRRPQLADFRIFAANQALVPAPEPLPSTSSTLGQQLFPAPRDTKDAPATGAARRGSFMNSLIIPQPGTQLVFWTITDPDEDTIAATFSIAPEDTDAWIDLAVRTSDSYVQFDVSHLPEGRYRTKLHAEEIAPRPAGQRLSYTFEPEMLTVDRTPPEIIRTEVSRSDGLWRVSVEGRDAFSLLEGAGFILNNGVRQAIEQPLDGVLDSRHETFVAEFTESRAAGATSVEIVLYDRAGNTASRRLALNSR